MNLTSSERANRHANAIRQNQTEAVVARGERRRLTDELNAIEGWQVRDPEGKRSARPNHEEQVVDRRIQVYVLVTVRSAHDAELQAWNHWDEADQQHAEHSAGRNVAGDETGGRAKLRANRQCQIEWRVVGRASREWSSQQRNIDIARIDDATTRSPAT